MPRFDWGTPLKAQTLHLNTTGTVSDYANRFNLLYSFGMEIVITLDEIQEPQDRGKTPRRFVSVGSVGRTLGEASYVLYNPGTNVVTFKTVKAHDFSDLHQRSTPVL